MPANGAFLAALFHAKFFVYAGLNGGGDPAYPGNQGGPPLRALARAAPALCGLLRDFNAF